MISMNPHIPSPYLISITLIFCSICCLTEALGQNSKLATFSNKRLIEELELARWQEEARKGFEIEYVEQMQQVLPQVPVAERRRWINDLKNKLSRAFEDVLDDQQRAIVQQYVFWRKTGAKSNSLAHWESQFVSEMLGLSEKQKDKLREINKQLKIEIEDLNKEYTRKLKENSIEMDKSARQTLLPFQRSLVSEKLGTDFDFDDTGLKRDLSIVSQMKKLHGGSNESVSISVDYRSILLLLGVYSDLKAEPEFSILLAFATDKKVAEELSLNETQNKKLAEYYEIVDRFLKNEEQLPHLGDNEKKLELLRSINDKKLAANNLDRLQMLQGLLNKKQYSRLLEIRNQFIVKASAQEQIIWFHQGLIELVQMTNSQKQELEKIRQKFAKNKVKFRAEMLENVKTSISESRSQALNVLTKEQQAIWHTKTGVFGKLNK
jgi:hypothetical protein